MRIMQAYVSKSVMSFPFHEIYALDDYNNRRNEAVFFGMYRYEDWVLLDVHGTDGSIVFWTGQDILQWDDLHLAVMHERCKSKTAHIKVHQYLINKGHDCELVQPAAFLNSVNPQKLGPKIYAYCPKEAEEYHGKKVLDELRLMGYDILIGDGSIPQNLWKHSCNGFYDDIFVGLCLSEFAGGGTSIIEMGLRGIPVITNVFELPNCYRWNGVEDVAAEIEALKQRIGTTDHSLANEVWQSLDHEHKWLEI